MEKRVFFFQGEGWPLEERILRAACHEQGCEEWVSWEGEYCHRHVDAHQCRKCGCVDCADHAEG
jgi:hypothetical protein